MTSRQGNKNVIERLARDAEEMAWGMEVNRGIPRHKRDAELSPAVPSDGEDSAFVVDSMDRDAADTFLGRVGNADPSFIMQSREGIDLVDELAASDQAMSPIGEHSHRALSDTGMVIANVEQPVPEIILRWKRFAILVIVSALVISALTAKLVWGFTLTPMHDTPEKIEDRVTNVYNTYAGIFMGIVESIVGIALSHFFPVFIVYVHNLKWYPGDDPATKESKVKKICLMLFFPLVMVAVGNSFSAVQANQKDLSTKNSTISTRHLMAQDFVPLDHTILKSAVEGFTSSSVASNSCSSGPTSPVPRFEVDEAAVRFGFRVHEWCKDFHPGERSTRKLAIPYADLSDVTAVQNASRMINLTTVMELTSQGMTLFERSLADLNAAAVATCSQRGGSGCENRLNSSLPALYSLVSSSDAMNFSVAVDAFGDALKLHVPNVDRESMQLTLEEIQVNPMINFQVVTFEVALQGSLSDPVCGDIGCVVADVYTQVKPRQEILMVPYSTKCSSSIRYSSRFGTFSPERCEIEANSALVYGFSTGVKSSSGKLERLFRFSFGKMTWKAASLSVPNTEDKVGLQYDLSEGHVFVDEVMFSKTLQSANFDRPVQLVELRMPVVKYGEHVGTVELTTPASSRSSRDCSGAVDAFANVISENHLRLDNLPETMATASLLYLFQDGEVSGALSRVSRSLASKISEYKIYVKNTRAGIAATWISCGILFLLTFASLAIPNERTRLEPPKGGNARAERFISVQTEEIYPNLVYKKRFKIGKTGEEIKFSEFAVETVGLHHKMEEDAQIYL